MLKWKSRELTNISQNGQTKTYPNFNARKNLKNNNMGMGNSNRRQNDTGNKMNSQFETKTSDFEWFSLALNEFIGIINTAQLFLFEEPTWSVRWLKTRLCGKAHHMRTFSRKLGKPLTQHSLKWDLPRRVSHNRRQSGYGGAGAQNKSFSWQMYKTCKNVILKPIIIHCAIHQQVPEAIYESIVHCKHSGINHELCVLL